MNVKEGWNIEHAQHSMLKSVWQGSDIVGIWGWHASSDRHQPSPPYDDDGGFQLYWLLLFADF